MPNVFSIMPNICDMQNISSEKHLRSYSNQIANNKSVKVELKKFSKYLECDLSFFLFYAFVSFCFKIFSRNFIEIMKLQIFYY